MDKTNFSPEDECCPMDIDEPVLDSTFKVDNQCQWDISMQDVDLGNEHEAISSSQPSFTQIENIHHNLPNIINTKNPFTPHVIIPEIMNTTLPSNAFVGSVNQNFNLSQNQIINGNFEVNPLSVENNPISNQEITNACEEMELSCSNQMIDSLNISEGISSIKVFKDSIEADSLIVSVESVFNEAFNISTDSLEMPYRVSNVQKSTCDVDIKSIEIVPKNLENSETKPISEVELGNKLSTDLSFDIITSKSEVTLSTDSASTNIVVKSPDDSQNSLLSIKESTVTDSNKISNALNSVTAVVESAESVPKKVDTQLSNIANAFDSVSMIVTTAETNFNKTDLESAKTESNKMANISTTVIESTESNTELAYLETFNKVPNILNSTVVIESVESNSQNITNTQLTGIESAKMDSDKINILNSTVVVESAESDPKISNKINSTITEKPVETDSNQISLILNSTSYVDSTKINSNISGNSTTSESLSASKILHDVEIPEIIENVSNLNILDTTKSIDTIENIEKSLNNSGVTNNSFELKDLKSTISNISVTEKKSSEADVLFEQVINSLEACSFPKTSEFEKLESCKIPMTSECEKEPFKSDIINSFSEISLVSENSNLLEAEKLESNITTDSEKLENLMKPCSISDSELNAELAIVPSGVTIATPKKLMVDDSSPKFPISSSVNDKNSSLNENCSKSIDEDSKTISKITSPERLAEMVSDKPPISTRGSVFTNISRAANILIESPKKIAEIINKKSPKKNIVAESINQSSSPLKHVDSKEIKSESCNKSSILVDSPVKFFDILNQNVSNVQNSKSDSVASSSISSDGVKEYVDVNSELLKEASKCSISTPNLDHSNEVSIDKMKLVEMSSSKTQCTILDQINEVSSSNENPSILESSSSVFLHNPHEISQENQQISINTLNFAGSETIAFETNSPVLPKTGELQNPLQPVSKAPVGKTIPLNLDQLSGCISLDSSKLISKPELVKRSSTSEYAVSPDFDLKEQEIAMKRGSISESDLIDSVEKFSVHDASAESKSKSDGVLDTTHTSGVRDVLNSTATIDIYGANTPEGVLNTTSKITLENLNTTNTLQDDVFNTTNTAMSSNLSGSSAINENVLNTTNTVISENLNTTNTTENLLNITETITHENVSNANTGGSAKIVNVEDILNTTNTNITQSVIVTNEIAGNNLDLINTINTDDCLNKANVDTKHSPSILNLTNSPPPANQECLTTTHIQNHPNSENTKILDITNTENVFVANNSDTGINEVKDPSGNSFSELNAFAENTFNSTVILCNAKLNSTQVLTGQPDIFKKQNADRFITGLIDEIVKNSLDDSETNSSPMVKSQEIALTELQFDKSFDEKAGLNKSLIRKKRNSPLKLLPNDEGTVKFEAATSPKRVDLPQIHKIISPVSNVKSCENLKKIHSPKLKDSEEKGNTLCSPKITLKSVCRKSDKFVSSNMEEPLCSDEPLDDTVELGNTTLLMSSTKVSDDSFNAVCANNNPEDQDGLVCDSVKSPKTVLVKESQLVSVEDRSPFKKINSNWKDSKVKKVEETIMPDVVIKAEEVNEAKISYENKENFNLSIFSNSPAKSKPSNRRDTLLRLFDPLYDSLSPDTPVSSNSPQSIEKNETISNKVSSSLICINEGPNAADIALISCNKIKEDLSDERDIETFLEALPETLHSFKAKMDDAIDERMKMEQELNELKLELNQLQQERTSLQLELHQKEEVILKIQGEAQKLGNQYKQEIKQLQDKLNTINEQNNNEEVKILREEISKLKDRDAQLNEKNSKLVDQIAALENTVHNYETTLDRVIKESEKLRVEHDNTKKHLATLEVSFSDVHSKYERTKEFVVAYKNNEEVLSDKLEKSEEIARRYEERYETLKAHAKAQIDKANKELSTMKEKHQIELNKMTALLRRLEIKAGSIQQALDQKTKECAALAALCDEMAGSVPQ